MDIEEAKAKRTQGKWTADANVVRDRDGHCIGEFQSFPGLPSRANAAFTVWACNNAERFKRERDELGEALEGLVEFIANSGAEFGEVSREFWNAMYEPITKSRAVLDAVRANASLAKVSPQQDALRKRVEQIANDCEAADRQATGMARLVTKDQTAVFAFIGKELRAALDAVKEE